MRQLSIARGSELRDALSSLRARSSQVRLVHRLHCLLLIAAGCRCAQVAAWFDEHPRTVERWVHAWNEAGLEGLRDRVRPGRPPRLDDAALAALRAELRVSAAHHPGIRWTGRRLQTHVRARFGVALGLRQCQRLLRALEQVDREP